MRTASIRPIASFKALGIFVTSLVFGYIGYWSVTGLFSAEVLVPTKKYGLDYIVYTGWPKVMLCMSGLAVSMPFLTLLIIASYVKLRKIEIAPNKYSNRAAMGLFLLMIIGFIGFILSNMWQHFIGMVYI